MAHFTGWAHGEMMEMSIADLRFWHIEAVKLHNEMNRPPDKK